MARGAARVTGPVLAKSEVDYGPGKPDGDHCSICRHFDAPDRCDLVIGKIGPSMWCKQFAKKK